MNTSIEEAPDLRTELPEDPRLLEAAQEYLRRLEAGEKPARQDLLRRYPDLAEPLNQCLDGLDLVHQATMSPLGFASDSRSASAAGRTTAFKNSNAAEDVPRDPLGDFQILREIGRGGMGVVYEATQLSLGRRVALKILPFAAALDGRQLQRFKNEAQAAAHLQHASIVPVYAIGCERGVHYYAMQLIEGQSLADLIAELRAARQPREAANGQAETSKAAAALSTERSGQVRNFFRRIAGLGIKACAALEHAHQVGVIHRDIKPANLLLDVQGELWITDFGLASMQTDASLTLSGELLGTLRYMSPEQALGQREAMDHRTDVYALGATLYELLTLEPLFAGNDRQELMHRIASTEPRPPRRIDPAIPVELETILLKAISKNLQERYVTAQAMADDLQRFLDDRPIQARRPGLLDRGRKWMRRHPSIVAMTVLVLLFGIMALAVATAFVTHEQGLTQDAYNLLTQEQARTKDAYKKERHRAEEAEERFQLARGAADDLIQMAEWELADHPNLDGLRKRLLESALAYYQKFIELRRDDPTAQAELASTRDRVKGIVDDLTVLQGAGLVLMLRDKNVLDDLRATGEQRGRLKEVTKRLDEKRDESFRDFHRINPQERDKRYLEIARTSETAIAAILTADQLKRLRQIAVQFKGPAAFRELEIVRDLKLTAEQKERIRAVEASPPGKGRHGPPELWRKAQVEQIKALLTEDQAQRWSDLAGPAFQGPMPQFAGPWRQPGPPPGKGKGKDGPFGPRGN